MTRESRSREAQRRYRIVLDPAASAGSPAHRLEIDATVTPGAVTAALHVVFTGQPGVQGVDLVVDGEPVGVAGRARLFALIDAAGEVRGGDTLGAGDGATLPGPPTRFVVFTFRCARCGETAYRIAADEPAPDCGRRRHGRMERVG